jgi:hypothetical protein
MKSRLRPFTGLVTLTTTSIELAERKESRIMTAFVLPQHHLILPEVIAS